MANFFDQFDQSAPIPGLIAPGNIDLANRPRVKNPDGTISTVRSMGVNIGGKEVLIPTVSDDGRIMSDDEAIAQYRKSGKHLGMFDSPEASTAYAERLHDDQAEMYGGGNFFDKFDDAPGQSAPFQFAAGVNQRLARSYIEGPEKLIRMGIDMVRGGNPTWATTEAPFADLVANLGDIPDPVTGRQRIARRTGEEVGQNIPYAGLAFAGAPAAATANAALGPGANIAQRSAGALAEGIVNTPAAAAVGEAVSVLGAGAGAGMAQEIAPGSQGAEMTGQIVGGFSPLVLANTPAALMTRAVGAVRQRLSPAAQTQRAQETVAKVVGPGMQAGREGLLEGEQLRQQIPGYQPSLAESTGSPSLIATQRAMESRASGPALETLVARRQGNEAAVDRYAQGQADSIGPSDPAYIVDTANQRVRDLKTNIAAKRQIVTGKAENAAVRLPKRDLGVVGADIRAAILQKRKDARQEMNTLATELGINDADVTVPFRAFQERVKKSLTPDSVFEDTANRPKIADEIDAYTSRPANETTVKFKDIMALKSRISDDIRDALSGPTPSAKKVRSLTLLEKEVDALLDNVAQNLDPELVKNYATFRQRYKTEYIDRFNQGAAFKVRARDGRGFYQTPDERVAEQFLKDQSGAKQYKKVFGNDTAALEGVLLDDLRASAVRDGQINPSLLNAWVRKNQSVLNEFPNTLKQVNDLQGLDASLRARNATLTARERKIDQSLLARELESFARGGRRPEDVVGDALKSPRLMTQLYNRVKDDPGASAALKRAVWDGVSKETSESVSQHLNNPSVQKILGPKHVQALKNILKATQQINRVPAPSGRPYDPNALAEIEAQLGTGMNQISSRVFAVSSGRTSARYVALDLLSRFYRGHSQQELARVLDNALYDPKVAQDLADLITIPAARREKANRLNTWLFNVGSEQEDRR